MERVKISVAEATCDLRTARRTDKQRDGNTHIKQTALHASITNGYIAETDRSEEQMNRETHHRNSRLNQESPHPSDDSKSAR